MKLTQLSSSLRVQFFFFEIGPVLHSLFSSGGESRWCVMKVWLNIILRVQVNASPLEPSF